jgi:hypothetical protein
MLLALALALGGVQPGTVQKAGPAAEVPQGIFSSVRDSEATGDMSGYEIRFFSQDHQPMAELTVCEGWCNAWCTVPVVQAGNRFEVRFDEHYDGAPTDHNRLVMAWGKVLAGKAPALRLVHWVNGKKLSFVAVLRRVPKLYGLAVARDGEARCRAEGRCTDANTH